MRHIPRSSKYVASTALLAACTAFGSPTALAVTQEPASSRDGKYMDKGGNPTYHVAGKKVDWYTYSGYRHYHGDCHMCHGPDGMGSTYAPALTDSMKAMTYHEFSALVLNGRMDISKSSTKVMPPFSTNKNVACYIDDIYVYLKARADGAIDRGRPAEKEDKPHAAKTNEEACLHTK